ncbi:Diguanylate cyclase with PAS/PAC sensor [Pseudomonas sp. 8Z]|uniref:sensor domain-containing diguanylate cyclase n=1 Tax=Pseudomonas sp. 8Z TaxID=2653166 RepID=UPI0012F2D690|nr:diguanylate cyclase [Pseudomonas sp. 8Z]VXD02465.1 Diguanylate cyclase with PAS/PAC sensor [Pseudomonas sp. 8Z]
MSLRKRLFSLFVPLLIVTLLSVQFLSNHLLLRRFDLQDEQMLSDAASKAEHILFSHIEQAAQLLRSYGWWNQSYEVAQTRSPLDDYLQENLDATELDNYDFDFMAMFDAQGRLLLERWATIDTTKLLRLDNAAIPTRADLRNELYSRSAQMGMLDAKGDPRFATAQIVLIRGIPALILSSAISNNNGTAPAAGTFMAGRFFNTSRTEALEHQFVGNVTFVPMSADDTRDWQQKHGNEALSVKVSPRQLLPNNQQRILLQIDTQWQAPELALSMTTKRSNYSGGRAALGFFLAISFAIVLGAAVVVYLGLEFWLLRRLEMLNREIDGIGDQAKLPRLISLGKDELGQLSSALNRMLERLEQSEERDRAILESIQDSYFEMDERGHFQRVNSAMLQTLGYSSEELLGQPLTLLLQPADHPKAQQYLHNARDDSSLHSITTQLRRSDGSLGDFEARLSLMHNGAGQFAGYRGILRDVSAQVSQRRELHALAYKDPLTGLGNRKAFLEHLRQRIADSLNSGSQLALFFIDLDHFKQVNDRFGHDVGDELLRAIASRLQHNLRQPNNLYRLGGDEFTLLLANTDATTAQVLGERLNETLQKPFDIAGRRIDFVSLSIGIALCPHDGKDPTTLVKAADSAMYLAKEQRGHVVLGQASSPTDD